MKILELISIFCIFFCFVNSQSGVIQTGEDWSYPISITPSKNSGFFSEESSSANNVNLFVFDVAWKQISPTASGQYSFTSSATVKDMPFSSFSTQNSTSSPFWMRIWTSATTWAPQWVQNKCGVSGVGEDDDGDSHLPIWNSCVWGEIKAMYTYIFKTLNMRADERLKFIYVPGGFNWCEFDFTIIGGYASSNTSFTYQVFDSWYQTAMQDLVDIFGEYSYKLVYTGEDFPFDVPDNWYPNVAYTARDAVQKGMGIRTGITELSNFHLSQIPAYGITIDSSGYMILNNSWVLQKNPNRIIATENECYNACGYNVAPENLFYAIKMSNLKAIQMGVNWLYVQKVDSYLTQFSDHWNWVRMNLGRTPSDAVEAWVSLRDAQDTFWNDFTDVTLQWSGKPYVKNYERFLYQRDSPSATTNRGSTQYTGILESENGIAWEGRSTNISSSNTMITFKLDDDFIFGPGNVSLKVTYLEKSVSSFSIQYFNNQNQQVSTELVSVLSGGSTKTVTFTLDNVKFSNQFSDSSDFRVVNNGTADIELLFVRVIKLSNISSGVDTSSSSSSTENDLPSSSNSKYVNIIFISTISFVISVLF